MSLATMFRAVSCAVAAMAVTTAQPASAQQQSALRDNIAPPLMPGEIELKSGSPALAMLPEGWLQVGRSIIVHNVSKPTLTPFLPPAGTGSGAAVVIAPGGGFMMLSMSSEGWDVARWLASNGIAAFVLKYRLLPTPGDAAGTFATMQQRLRTAKPFQRAEWFLDGTRLATEDALGAMRLVRANAAKWSIDPRKVGFMGFSAGAFTTLNLVSKSTPPAMPNFVAPIYGSLGTPFEPLPDALPPMWTSIAADDPLLGKTDFGLINAWRAKGGSVEFHLYEKGGHGYGLAGTSGTTTVEWPNDFLAWLRTKDFYTPTKG